MLLGISFLTKGISQNDSQEVHRTLRTSDPSNLWDGPAGRFKPNINGFDTGTEPGRHRRLFVQLSVRKRKGLIRRPRNVFRNPFRDYGSHGQVRLTLRGSHRTDRGFPQGSSGKNYPVPRFFILNTAGFRRTLNDQVSRFGLPRGNVTIVNRRGTTRQIRRRLRRHLQSGAHSGRVNRDLLTRSD